MVATFKYQSHSKYTMALTWILIAILILLILLGIAALFYAKKPHKPDYYALFTIGIIWIAAGIPMKNYALSTMGAILAVTGILNKDKWKTNRQKLSPKEQKTMYIALITGLTALVALIFILLVLE